MNRLISLAFPQKNISSRNSLELCKVCKENTLENKAIFNNRKLFKRRHNQLLKAPLIMVSFVFIFCKSKLRPFDTSIHSCMSLK